MMKKLDVQLFQLLRTEGTLTRPEMVASTGVARSTLYDALERLELLNMVERFRSGSNQKLVYWRLRYQERKGV